jgi:hypothetical protein
MRCAIRWACGHCQEEFYVDPNSVDMTAVLALNDTQCPTCGRTGAVITLRADAPSDATPLKSLESLESLQEHNGTY